MRSQGAGIVNYARAETRENVTLELTDTRVCSNQGEEGVGIHNTGWLSLMGTLLCENVATSGHGHVGFAGAALYNEGAAYLGHGTIMQGNTAAPGSGSSVYNGGEVVYILPAPLGHYVQGIFQCEQLLCDSLTKDMVVPCPVQSCNYDLHRGKWVARMLQGANDAPFYPQRCPSGSYGDSILPQVQSSEFCAGLCPRGHFCPTPATVKPELTPPGTHAPMGSKVPLPCQDKTYYCPGGEGDPTAVPLGMIATSFTEPSPGNITVYIGKAPCPAGHWCERGEALKCSVGTYALAFTTRSCCVYLLRNSHARISRSRRYTENVPAVRSSLLSCLNCPGHTTTMGRGTISRTQCVCDRGFYHKRPYDVITPICLPCPPGASCPVNTTEDQLKTDCPWQLGLTHGHSPYTMLCADNSTCSTIKDGSGCCDCHKGPLKCPSTEPNMCSGTDDCGEDEVCCLPFGCQIERPCPSEFHPPVGKCVPPPPTPPMPPPSPPAPPSPPPQPPKSPLPVGEVHVSDVAALYAALEDQSAVRVVLMAAGSPFRLTRELIISRSLILCAEPLAPYAVLEGGASIDDPRRVLSVVPSDSNYVQVQLRRLRITGGRIHDGVGGGLLNKGALLMEECDVSYNTARTGGGIFNEGTLKLTDCQIHHNQARVKGDVSPSGFGGGLFSYPGTHLLVQSCKIFANEARGGAGMVSHAQGTMNDTDIFENVAVMRGGGVETGREMLNDKNLDAALVMENCKIQHNRAGQYGGGVLLSGEDSQLIMRSSSIIWNQAQRGAGIANLRENSGPSTVRLENATVSHNSGEKGGGIYNAGLLELWFSLLSDNNATSKTFDGSSLYNTGTVYLVNGTVIRTSGDTIVNAVYNGGNATYVLPTPDGYWVPMATRCEPQYCDSQSFTDTHEVLCPQQSCDIEKNLSGLVVSKLPQGDLLPVVRQLGALVRSFPLPCPQGVVGSKSWLDPFSSAVNKTSLIPPTSGAWLAEANPVCAGKCPSGYYCPTEATITPLLAPVGTFAPMGSVRPRLCMDATYYCVGGGWEQIPVPPGMIATGFHISNVTLDNGTVVGGDYMLYDGIALCPAGHWCHRGQQVQCSEGSYTEDFASLRLSQESCTPCPDRSTTVRAGATSINACGCFPGFYLSNKTASCEICPAGSECDHTGTVPQTINISAGFWRLSALSVDVKPCPRLTAASCSGGTDANVTYDPRSSDLCSQASGATGVFCTLCLKPAEYFDWIAARCKACGYTVAADIGKLFGAGIVFLGLFLLRERLRKLDSYRRLVNLTVRAAMRSKIKHLVAYYQIISQLGSVYRVSYPQAYEQLLSGFRWLELNIGFVPSLQLHCVGLRSLGSKLLSYIIAPLLVMAIALAVSLKRYGSILPAVPFSLYVSFLVFPSVSSRGWRVLSECECFVDDSTNCGVGCSGKAQCFSHSDYTLRCPSKDEDINQPEFSEFVWTRKVAIGAIFVYAVAVPLSYSLLLFANRHAIQHGPSTRTSDALRFLHADYRRGVYWWEAVESLRKVAITGIMSIVEPGTAFQLSTACALATGLAVLQARSSPYKEDSTNILANVDALALAFVLVATAWLRCAPEEAEASTALLVLLCGLTLVVLIVGVGLYLGKLANERRLHVLRLVATRRLPELRLTQGFSHHAMISYLWASGQDQVASLKSHLAVLLPGIRIFLDVEALESTVDLERHVEEARVFLLFMSRGYFASTNCAREVGAASSEALQRPLVVVHEANVDKGGASRDEMHTECSTYCAARILDYVFRKSSAAGPCGDNNNQLTAGSSGWTPVTFHRLKEFQLLTLRLIAERFVVHLLPATELERLWSASSSQHPSNSTDGTEERGLLYFPDAPGPLRFAERAVIYTSPLNPRAAEVVDELCGRFPDAASRTSDAPSCARVLPPEQQQEEERAPAEDRVEDTTPTVAVEGTELTWRNLAAVAALVARRRQQRHATNRHAQRRPTLADVSAHNSAEPTHWVFVVDRHTFARRDAGDEPSASLHTDARPAGNMSTLTERGQELTRSLTLALRGGVKVIVVHETDPSLGGCPFAVIHAATPDVLKDAGLYGPLAVPWHSEAYRAVSLKQLAEALGARSEERSQQQPLTCDDGARRLAALCCPSFRTPRRSWREMMGEREVAIELSNHDAPLDAHGKSVKSVRGTSMVVPSGKDHV